MKTIKDLEILEKYLSPDELKEVAKEVAYRQFTDSIGKQNPHAKANYEYYLKHGAVEAVREHISDFDKETLAKDLTTKTKSLIQKLSVYNLPKDYEDIARQCIVDNKELVENAIKKHISKFVNDEDYCNTYSTFQEKVGETMADIIYGLLEKEFKEKNGKNR